MNTTVRPRPLRVAVAGIALATGVVVGGALLAVITNALTGSASPLPAAPWHWSLTDIAQWFSSDATASSAVDVAVRVLASIAWLALIVLAVNLARELAFQSRHGVIRQATQPAKPSGGRGDAATPPKVRREHGLAATLIAILLGGSTLAAGAVTALPTRTAVSVDASPIGAAQPPSMAAELTADSLLPAGWTWTTHTIDSPHESLASIARTIGDDPALPRLIWDANRDRDMGNGDRFADPAVVKLGWTLRIPTPTPTPPMPPRPPPPRSHPIRPTAQHRQPTSSSPQTATHCGTRSTTSSRPPP
jgi:hypothetical protein